MGASAEALMVWRPKGGEDGGVSGAEGEEVRSLT